jgi:HSP20 family molecular chaperone IbpA
MKVTNEQTTANYLQKLNDAQRDLVTAKEVELKNIENLYDDKFDAARVDGESDLLDLQERQNADLNQALLRKQEKLIGYKDDLEKTKDKLSSERENLKITHQDQIKDLNTVYDDKFKTTYSDAQLKALEVHDNTTNELKDLHEKSDRLLQNSHHQAKMKLDKSATNNDAVIRDQESKFLEAQKANKFMYEHRVERQKLEHDSLINKQGNKNIIEKKERNKIHDNQMKSLEAHHKELINQKNTSFKNKYQTLVNSHKNIIDRMQQRFKQELEGLVSVHSQYKDSISSKAEDEFYHVSKLQPAIEDLGKEYLISIEVPEHEKDNVRLSAHDRNVNVSLTRRFSDRTIEEDGDVNKTSRSEVFTKRFEVNDIINHQEIKQQYKEGVLTFQVPKR